MRNDDNDTGQITRLFGTELLSSEECGIYITNIEINNIAKELGFDITLTSNEFIIGEIFKVCSKENKLNKLYKRILEIFSSRISEYEKLKALYPAANVPVSLWLSRANRTMKKLQENIKEIA
jgi:hypothetical protein